MVQRIPFLRRNRNQLPEALTLRLADIHDLFAAPRSDPFLETYQPVAGINQLLLQLNLLRLRDGLHVTFVVPKTDVTVTQLESELKTALKRFCDNRLANLDIELKTRQRNVLRGIQVGLIILAISLGLAAAVSNAPNLPSWLQTLLSNSISIFGTVALWSPTDAFLFGMRPLYREIRTYRAIRDMTFEVQVE